MKDLPEETLIQIVRRARCARCDGKGFRLAPAENRNGDRIVGRSDPIECRDCDGNGIRLAYCRRLEAQHRACGAGAKAIE